MEELKAALGWCLANVDNLIAIAALLLAVIRYLHFQWAQSNALKVVAEAIESTNAEDVKKRVAWLQDNAPKAVRDVLNDAVATVDQTKQTPSPVLIILREVLRGIVNIQATKKT